MTTVHANLASTSVSQDCTMASTRLFDEEVDGELSPPSQAHSRDDTHAGFSWDFFFGDTQHFESLDGDSTTADGSMLDPLPAMPLELSMTEFLQLCEEAFSITAKRQVISVGSETYALMGDGSDCVDLTEPLVDILVVSGQAYRVADPAGDWCVELTQPLENVVVVKGTAVARRPRSRHIGKPVQDLNG
ncbi:hypothetical protein JDV02_010565 [Purpureocillium takamizusanense]|uniref:Uncharacterized protein n=1 Tax=Purpureocillium takamizusanense TaxID=2060973 RepID=A0A9Q8QUQ9_9HYPO|nr:uncharacterized protein JDV02_010565 [Purpureocillium takamizusanense]UNI24847.1 hypothetical protein JDV02_010565 [Purpureocillium takamizusanense]